MFRGRWDRGRNHSCRVVGHYGLGGRYAQSEASRMRPPPLNRFLFYWNISIEASISIYGRRSRCSLCGWISSLKSRISITLILSSPNTSFSAFEVQNCKIKRLVTFLKHRKMCALFNLMRVDDATKYVRKSGCNKRYFIHFCILHFKMSRMKLQWLIPF